MSYPLGFAVTALHSGIKKQALDLALLTSSKPCSAAGVFTSNVFKAAPVQIDQKQLALHNGRNFKSVVINSGCANAVTGRKGLQDAELMNKTASKVAGGESLCMSTGVIGQLLPIEKITKHTDLGLQQMLKQHKFGTNQAESSGENDWQTLAKGIMTTDTFPKLTSTKFKIGTHEYSIAGVAKGAGMISPNMATLLSVLATDAPVAPAALQLVLKNAVNKSFNSISVDGDMSTNDTVLMLANGVGGGPEITTNNVAELEQAVTKVCSDLAKLIVKDGEGATKFVTINVKGAKTNADAKKIAKTIADSSLVKTALYGKDANWGRILCAIGYSNVEVNPLTTSVSFKPADGSADLKLLTNGEPENVDEERASEILEMPDLNIEVNLGPDEGAATFWTCDLSHEYVTINGDYRS